ncbi:MAG: hypothetical protein JWO94_2495 [Verrucomicrobiaceae bacterium]|nr:hypothetical protein [Verrucomicrobiaceae bacterium]
MLLSVTATVASAQEEVARLIWQPVLDYTVREPVTGHSMKPDGRHRMNSFVNYTHLGTDFGFHGPGEPDMTWDDGRVSVDLKGSEAWAGMWHSLAGLAADTSTVFNFDQCYSALLAPGVQPTAIELMVTVAGKGRLKLEIKSASQKPLWSHVIEVDNTDQRPFSSVLPSHELHEAKFVNWTVEPGSELCLTKLDLGIHMPALAFDRYVLLASYAKMARCYSPRLGFVKDRAHVRDGDFNSLPATGLFALSTAMMSQPEVAMVPVDAARAVVRKIWQSVAAIPTAKGLLPHFVKMVEGRPVIHPGTEFSSVDTAIYYQALFLAAQMLDDHETTKAVMDRIKAVDFAALLLPDGAISHGLRDDGTTILQFGWRDWGGESAMVMLMARMAGARLPEQVMKGNGEPWQGTGFIAEIQSLFYPDFDSNVPDAISKVNWHGARAGLLARQKSYFPAALQDSAAARIGFYGLSAGEGAYGTTYEVGGVDLPSQRLVHPHYILMSGTLEENPQTIYALLRRMEHSGWLTPWGLVENILADGSGYLPMISSLNAGFETLGAYHLLAKARHEEDCIYKTSRQSSEIREAMTLFYPGVVAKK